jgi:hypothetical protein
MATTQRITQALRQVIAESDAEKFRITQAIRQVMAGADGEEFRITQAVRQVMASSPGSFRVTQAIRQVVHSANNPNTPSITHVDGLTASTAVAHSTDYYHPSGDAHEGSRYQVRVAGAPDWSALVYDTGWLGPVTQGNLAGMIALTGYQVRVKYRDADLDESDWSPPFYFTTTSEAVSPGNFDWDDFAQMWNIGEAFFGSVGRYFGPGGWSGPLNWSMWDAGGGKKLFPAWVPGPQ